MMYPNSLRHDFDDFTRDVAGQNTILNRHLHILTFMNFFGDRAFMSSASHKASSQCWKSNTNELVKHRAEYGSIS